jgi:ADP-heptose:LPS heptosyltransferase
VFTTPAVRALRRRFPEASITYLVEPAAAAVVRLNPHLTEVIVAPRRPGITGLGADLALGRRLRLASFDIALDFHGGPRASLLTWMSGAPIRIGYEIAGRGWMYTHRVPRARILRARHSVENQWDLLTVLGVAEPNPTHDPVEMPVDTEAAHLVVERLEQAGIGHRDQLIVMHVSAGNPFRRWPIRSFADVLARLIERRRERRGIVSSGPSEHDAAARVIAEARAQLSNEDQRRVVACGEFSLVELRALFERAALYIGGDSGPMHIAASSRVPIVALYGPTLPARSAPWRPSDIPVAAVEVAGLACRPCDQRVCAPGDFRCLTWIQPQQVLDAAERALSAGSTVR